MFNGEILITGKHANYIRFLNDKDKSINAKFFERYIDIIMVGAVIGFIYGRKEERDTSTSLEAKVFPETVLAESEKLKFIFRTIMLLEDRSNLTDEERIERAFRDEYRNPERHKKNMDLFYSYVRGGISYLYDRLNQNAFNKSEYINNLKDFIDDFNYDFISEKYTQDIDYDEL